MRSFLATAIALTLIAGTAHAQQPPTPCGERNEVLMRLNEKFKEAPTAIGLTGNGAAVELMTSESGSWTLVLSFPNGRSCLLAAGDGWELWKPKLAGRDS